MSAPPLAVVTEHLDPVCAEWLAERCAVVHCAPESAEFAAHLARSRALVVRTYTRVDEFLLSRAPELRVVGRAGVGLDNIDLAACAARGVRVVHTPDANTRAVAEYAIALMLDALRPRPTVGRAVDVGSWKALRADAIGRKQLGECVVGLVGFGRVGRRVASCLAGFGTRVIYHDLLEIPEADRRGAEPVPMDELLAASDVVSLHVDDRPSNRGLIGGPTLSKCRADALILNTSRGFVIDAPALAGFLRRNGAAGARAVLDVHEPEPPPAGHPLIGLANCRLLPHLGAATATAHRNMSWVVRDVWRVLAGERPEHEATPAGSTMPA